MTRLWLWAYRGVQGRPALRVVLQAAVSVALLAALILVARRGEVLASLKMLAPGAIAAAIGLQLAACLLSARRWQILLQRVRIREPLGRLTALYLIGMFFSLFLPTSAGGDAVRIYQVARRNGNAGRVLLATLQERFLGLGATVTIGLIATIGYWWSLPPALRLWGTLLQVAGIAAVGVLLYPRLLLALTVRLGLGRSERPLLLRLRARLHALVDVPVLGPGSFLRLFALAAGAVLLNIASCRILARSLGVEASFTAFCLVIPLVWLVRMLPVSLNGLGVGEGAFVFLLGLYAVPTDKALALALALLGLQTVVGLLGGLLVVLRLAAGTGRSTAARGCRAGAGCRSFRRGAAPCRVRPIPLFRSPMFPWPCSPADSPRACAPSPRPSPRPSSRWADARSSTINSHSCDATASATWCSAWDTWATNSRSTWGMERRTEWSWRIPTTGLSCWARAGHCRRRPRCWARYSG